MNKNSWLTILALIVAASLLVAACNRAESVSPATEPPGAQPNTQAPLPPSEAVQAALAISPPGSSGVFLFTDDFQDGEADNWEATGAWFVEQSADLYVFGATGAGGAWVPGGHDWADYIFHAGVRVERGALFLSMNVTQGGRYLLRLDENEVALIKEQPAENYAVLATTGPIGTGMGRSVLLASQQGHIQVYVDEDLWIDYVDANPLTLGTIGVSSLEDSVVAVDNIFVLQLDGILPTGEPVVAPLPVVEPVAAEVVAAEAAEVPLEEVEQSFAAEEQEQEEEAAEAEAAGALPDLVAFQVEFDPNPVIQGQPFQVVLYVINLGDAPSGAFTIRMHFHAATGVPDCNADFWGLAVGEGGTAFCTSVTNANPGTSPTEFTVDVEGEITESDEGNNLYTPTFTVEAGQGGEDEPVGELASPVNCSADPGQTSVIISWNVPGVLAGHLGFRVYQGVDSLELEEAGPGLRSTSIGDLEPGTQYHFDVRAYNAAIESERDACSVDVTTLP